MTSFVRECASLIGRFPEIEWTLDLSMCPRISGYPRCKPDYHVHLYKVCHVHDRLSHGRTSAWHCWWRRDMSSNDSDLGYKIRDKHVRIGSRAWIGPVGEEEDWTTLDRAREDWWAEDASIWSNEFAPGSGADNARGMASQESHEMKKQIVCSPANDSLIYEMFPLWQIFTFSSGL